MGIDWINHPEKDGVPYQVKLLEGEIVGLKPWIFP
jgi:type 1 glutamine amidotransferase